MPKSLTLTAVPWLLDNEQTHTYRVGMKVKVYSFGRWRSGQVIQLGRTRVKVDYARNQQGKRNQKWFEGPYIVPANVPTAERLRH